MYTREVSVSRMSGIFVGSSNKKAFSLQATVRGNLQVECCVLERRSNPDMFKTDLLAFAD
ncbi:hypothetical protein FUA23_10215 [Neolewinella aurantiaca]|uniref:Uncharacterized protein n=1 Tax=Neolewinella aurantiaca TaxID=2602767 RepID=A0A5C7FSZ4_9BACT|nr:hypothetical protein [Neolewinella aurantiaca]TXF89565.1 hypothetical protein FUA23_10215 [Neolewinella aurantiaca]